MKTILFDFANAAQQKKTVDRITTLLRNHGATVVNAELTPTTSRTNGVSFREVHFTFVDSQKLTLRVKITGDIYQVLINGKIKPLREQEDSAKAIGEIATALDVGRSAWQKRLARLRTQDKSVTRSIVSRVQELKRVAASVEAKTALLADGRATLADIQRMTAEARAT